MQKQWNLTLCPFDGAIGLFIYDVESALGSSPGRRNRQDAGNISGDLDGAPAFEGLNLRVLSSSERLYPFC